MPLNWLKKIFGGKKEEAKPAQPQSAPAEAAESVAPTNEPEAVASEEETK